MMHYDDFKGWPKNANSLVVKMLDKLKKKY